MDPCGTPHVIDAHEDDLEYVSVYCLRFVNDKVYIVSV